MLLHYGKVPHCSPSVSLCAKIRIAGCYNISISSSYFWTDSKISLQYINNESRRFKTYVANRVSEIRDVSKPSQWRPCPGLFNPADDASRGLSAEKFVKSERWFRGQAFLSKPQKNGLRLKLVNCQKMTQKSRMRSLYSW